MKIDVELHEKKEALFAAMRNDRQPYWTLWRELANYYLPRRYQWLDSGQESRVRSAKNPYILDGTGTIAARTLASGMMNGITSPSRPWFRLRINNFDDDAGTPGRVWLDEVERRMSLVFAESNFYNCMATMYLDLVVFGSAAMLIYEDYSNVIHCYNSCLGEYYFAQNDKLQVDTFGREFVYTVQQCVQRFGEANVSQTVRDAWKLGGSRRMNPVKIRHLIEPNYDNYLPARFAYCETYWEISGIKGEILQKKGFTELPGLFPRWDLAGNDSYGSSPGMEALGDVIQLQHETKKKAQGLDKMVSPPMLADIQLQHRPTALQPNGVTFISGVNNNGMKPAYQIQIPINELSQDIMQVQQRVREIFHNDLFKMISQLETVRSAAEIGARREEKLVLLGPVLERFENEALDPAIKRVFSIMSRARLLPPAPEELQDADIEIQYVSILSAAQAATGVLPIEQWLTMIGNMSAIYPKALNVANPDELLRIYARDTGVPARGIRAKAETDAANKAMDEAAAQENAMATAGAAVQGAQVASETDVGGGQNMLQRMMGG
jgi:hypothetical protein